MGRLLIAPGAGGPEAVEWSKMLARQYRLWLERLGQSFNEGADGPVLYLDSPHLTFENFNEELGIHQLVRVPPNESQGRRHTSFAFVSLDGVESNHEACRLYVLDPYQSAKNQRTGATNGSVLELLEGHLEQAP